MAVLPRGEKITLTVPPVGAKFLGSGTPVGGDYAEYSGTSYCEAVLLATRGSRILVTPNSIQTCK
ncbi:MAG: hypothetical protein ACTSU5_13370 [Promethearchaeota archaeon]